MSSQQQRRRGEREREKEEINSNFNEFLLGARALAVFAIDIDLVQQINVFEEWKKSINDSFPFFLTANPLNSFFLSPAVSWPAQRG